MAIRDDFTAGEVLAAADLNDTFGSKLDLAGGKILQIVRATDTTNRTTTSTSFVDVTGMSVTITPQKSDSAVLVMAMFGALIETTSDQQEGQFQLSDSSNNALSGAEATRFSVLNLTGTLTRRLATPSILIGRSTPATTSAVTYKMRFRSGDAPAATTVNVRNDHSTGQMFAIEVSA